MSNIIHKIKDVVSHHDNHTSTDNNNVKPKVPNKNPNNQDLNNAPPSTRDPVDLTGRHIEPDNRDIDGRHHQTSLDAPDLTGPHRDHENVDINGLHPSTHDPPDLNQPR